MTVRHVVYFFILTLVITLQSTWVSQFLQWRSQPALYLIFLIWIGYTEGQLAAQILGFMAGFVLDIVSGFPLGLHPFVLALLGHLAGLTKGRFLFDQVFYPAVVSVLSVILYTLLVGSVVALFQLPLELEGLFSGHVFWSALLSALFSPMVFGMASVLRKRFVRSYVGFQNG